MIPAMIEAEEIWGDLDKEEVCEVQIPQIQIDMHGQTMEPKARSEPCRANPDL